MVSFKLKQLNSLAVLASSLFLSTAFALTKDQIALQHAVYKAQGYHILQNQNVEGYSVRIKQPQSCEEGVQYSGYIDKHDTNDHFFFYFFESRTDPENDPTVLWLNGGPGCSSMMGLWMELGPCQVNEFGNGTIRNPYSWNTAANVIFLDQPVNVGYSYGDSKIRDTSESARDVYAFLQLFFSEYTKYATSPFHLAGESYAGHYLPAISAEIIKRNQEIEEKGTDAHGLSVMIGNGWTNPQIQFREYAAYGCTNKDISDKPSSEYRPFLNQTVCAAMNNTYPRCQSLMDTCYRNPSPSTCVPADMFCEQSQTGAFDATGLNPYDIRRACEGTSGLCYDQIALIEQYANLQEVKENLGVDKSIVQYESCSDAVGYRFFQAGDNAHDYTQDIALTLASGVRVLIYVGDMDWICNWMGNLAWTLEMEWSGKEEYNQAPFESWYSDFTATQAGESKTANNLTFLKIFDAGHMVPFDQPKNALDFVNKWLNGFSLVN
ncbi:Alpha/Beta hydrolase protein [Mycotypha africana]|uniref:Alpha/Beta hydrolase protein n=1 Tax=Mycotypha africana TaxID=64632 RepID=UPI002300D7E0|nr:Alpha/Beta hydrolase protein [Mycotypha africana]KAI8968842.1 Alpha/Beta hydrolase protein [Mycotypha africana]